MEDLISRQALLDAFGFSEKTRKWGGDHSGYNTMMLYEIQNMIESAPPVKPQESKWIPVSERLPTKEEYIANNGLFIVSDGNRSYAEYFDIYDSKKYFGEPTMEGFKVDRCVTKWMPLPEPYKTESEGV